MSFAKLGGVFLGLSLVVGCGSSPPSGTVSMSGTAPGELDGRTPIASYAYGGGISNIGTSKEIRAATVSFFNHSETSCDGPYVGLDAGESVIDVGDISILLPDGEGLHDGQVIPLQSLDAQMQMTAAPTSAVATFQFTRATTSAISSSISGTLTLSRASSDHLTGTLTAQMGTTDVAGETVSVTFDAPACSSLW